MAAFAQSEDELPLNDSLYNSIEESNNLQIYGDSKGTPNKVLSLRNLCPPIKSDKSPNTGLSWAVAIAQTMSIQYKDLTNQQEFFSYQFIYDLLPKESPERCSLAKDWMVDTKKILETRGTLTIHQYPFTKIDCSRKPTTIQITQARKYCVRSFNRLFQVVASNESISIGGKIHNIKSSLNRKHPVVLCMIADNEFLSIKSEQWNPTFKSKAKLNTIVVIGYDENKQLFEVMGQSTNWGKNGFAYISFKDLVYAKYAFELVMNDVASPSLLIIADTKPRKIEKQQQIVIHNDKKEEKIERPSKPVFPDKKINLSGELIVNQVTNVGEYQKVILQRTESGYYKMPSIYSTDAQFQLISQKSQSGSYVYVFSVDPQGKAEIHFPYEHNPNTKNKVYGMTISPVIPNENTQVVIPSPRIEIDENGNSKRIERALTKTNEGTDWLVVLHSDRRLEGELDGLVAQLYQHNRDFMSQFASVFGDRLVDKNNVWFDGSSFKAALSEGYIVPMIIKIEAK